MTKQHANAPAPAVVWIPLADALAAFVKKHPETKQRAGRWAQVHLVRNHGDTLVEAGVLVRLYNRRWIADRDRFTEAFFAVLRGEEVAS